MTRVLPAALAGQVRAVPGDFSPTFTDQGRLVRWADTLIVEGHGPVEVELGYSKASGRADESKEQATLRAGVWQAMELARLGRIDLLGYCLVSRHQGRPGKKA